MYLKALEIQGFKSFPEKTVLQFGSDITAIVGPNGSGKSNISDAIRWVMGEQSSRALRGGKMEDVIFGGTEKRAAVGFAQVTLVLDNTGHLFPAMEESEVSVTRRYYRSGESEYYINRQSVRLKDVAELFMDTGMGREGYSIVGQGRVDEILSTKSTDRREIFEEAAGISKFRHRKEEAERKLQRTEENLVRINDKIAELELQVEPLRAQAETARKYLLLRDELRLLEVSLWLEQLQALKAAAQKLEIELHSLENQRDEARQTVERLFAQSEDVGRRMQEKDMEAEALRERLESLEAQAAQEAADAAALDSTLTHLGERIRTVQAELHENTSRSGTCETQAQAAEQEAAAIAREEQEANGRLQALLQQAQAAADKAGGAAAQAEVLGGQEALCAAAAADARMDAAARRAENQQMRRRIETAREELSAAQEQQEAHAGQARENRRRLDAAREEAQSAANIITGHTLRMAERQKKAAAAADERVKLTMEAGALEDRIALLREMEKDYEGFHKAVKTICQARTDLRGIHGPVASLIRTEGRYSLAIEIALGAGVQNIVVDREEDAKSAIAFLKRRDAGRATFLPLTAIRGQEMRRSGAEEEPGFVGLASRLVRFDARYTQIFHSLLGSTVVVEDLDCGIAMARKYRNAFRIVTLDGQVINRGGSMTGGSVSRSAGVLSRSAELEQLSRKSQAMQEALRSAQAAEETTRRDLEAAEYALSTARDQLREAEDAVLRLEGEAGQQQAVLTALAQRIEQLEGELTALSGRLEDNEAQAAAAEAAAAEKEAQAEGLRAQVQMQRSGQSQLLERSGQLREDVTALKEDLAALGARREAALRRAEDQRQLARDLAGDRRRREEALADYQGQLDRAQAEIGRRRSLHAQLKEQGEQQRQALGRISQEKIALEAERTAKARAGQEHNETLLDLERALSRAEGRIGASALEEKQILDKLWDTYELSHSDALAQRIELESVQKADRRVKELKREIGGLGTINIGAIEEFDRVNGRYTYLTEQRNDVGSAKAELEGIIQQITREMTEIFTQQFALLSQSFETTFTELFGGGQARLELEDPQQVLECGIEIKAQPPGKTLKTISLLSGGEKAFVAIALYFAILKVHPTPFCIMDEIEAALDEVNVVRTARYMRSLADKTQFIVITHRRGTMEAADVLYGVTMQEQGVSKMLTIDLNDMARELRLPEEQAQGG